MLFVNKAQWSGNTKNDRFMLEHNNDSMMFQDVLENEQLSVWELGLLELYRKITIKIERAFFVIAGLTGNQLHLPAVSAAFNSCRSKPLI